MQTILYYVVVLGFAGGVLLRSFLYIDTTLSLVGLVIAVGLVILWRRAGGFAIQDTAGSVILYSALLLCAVAIGMMRFDLAEMQLRDTTLTEVVETAVTLTGVVVREPDIRANQMLLTVQTADTKVLVSADRYATIAYGDVVTVRGVVAVPESFTTDLGRTFDYGGYLNARGITHTVSFAEVTVTGHDAPLPGVDALYQFKQYFLERLAMVIPEPAVALGAGLLLGVQSALGEDLEEAFRTTGIIHIVVLSGYNIMLVVAFVMLVLSFLLPYRARLLAGIGAVIVFALLVGYSPSVLRASVMAVLFLLVALLARPYHILRMLVLAGGIMVFANPYLLRYDIGFQLSFMATLGLILVAPQLEAAWVRVTAWLSMRSFLVATVATQIAVAPLLLYHMGEWSLVAVPVNLLVLPMVPLAMLLTFVTGLIAMISTTFASPVALLATGSLTYIITLAEVFARLPFAAVAVPPFPGLFVPLLYVLMAGAWYYGAYYRGRKDQGTLIEHGGTSMGETIPVYTIVEEPVTDLGAMPVSQPAPKVRTQEIAVPGDTTKSEKPVPIFFR